MTGADVSLVSPPTTYEPARVGVLRDFLAERLRPLMEACTLAAKEQKRDGDQTERSPTSRPRRRRVLTPTRRA